MRHVDSNVRRKFNSNNIVDVSTRITSIIPSTLQNASTASQDYQLKTETHKYQ